MNKRCNLFFFMVLCLNCISFVCAGNDNLSEENESVVRQQVEKIKKELEQLKDHPWAGEYYLGDGLGANVTLRLAPDSGFAYTWYGCLGLYNQNHGDLTWDGKSIKLAFGLPHDEKRDYGLAPEYLPIRWGERIYMIPANEIIEFCNYMNIGFEPRNGAHGFVFLRREDWVKKVEGKPELPKKHQPYLLDHPIEAKVVSCTTPETQPETDLKTSTVIIDKGKNDGLLPGMKLYATDSDSVDGIMLTKAEQTQSEGRFRCYGQKQPPQIGEKVSTWPKWRRQEPK